MNCINSRCNAKLVEGAVFCHVCGKKQIPEPKKYRKRPNGAGTVYKASGNRSRPWIAAKSKVIIGQYATRAEAMQALEKLSGKNISELYNYTFKDIYEAWNAEREDGDAEPYDAPYKHFVEIHESKFRSLKTADYQREIDKQIDAGMSRSSTEKDKLLISQMCKWAMREEIITVNYAQFIKLQKPVTKEKEIFTEEDIKKLAEAAKTDDAAKLICMMIGTGMRIGELFTLKLENCKDKYCIGGIKTEAGKDRIIPIRPEVRGYFEYFRSSAFGCELLIDGYSGNRQPDNFRKRDYYELLDRLGIEKKTPHATRHTYASRARAEGMPPEILQKILGHAKYETTADIYVHTDIEQLVEAVERVSNQLATESATNKNSDGG